MSNPNNCNTCDYKNRPDGGHCYMFRFAPTGPCAKHTVRAIAVRANIQQVFAKLVSGTKP